MDGKFFWQRLHTNAGAAAAETREQANIDVSRANNLK